jgi:thiamine-phosphate pyrophosphorylase
MTTQTDTHSGIHRPLFPKGLYGITPDWQDVERLDDAIQAAASGGMKVVQLRNKTADFNTRLAFAQRLLKTCQRLGVLFIVNDDWRLVQQLGEQGYLGAHIGRDDGNSQMVRAALGDSVVLGVSCYDDLIRAVAATQAISSQTSNATRLDTSTGLSGQVTVMRPTIDYVAFGAMFASHTKPGAPPATLNILTQARQHWHHQHDRPAIVAIGGINLDNVAQVVRAGADSIAVSGGLFLSTHIENTARQLTDCIYEHSTHAL